MDRFSGARRFPMPPRPDNLPPVAAQGKGPPGRDILGVEV